MAWIGDPPNGVYWPYGPATYTPPWTGGNVYPTSPMVLQGWECPRCKRINAPSVLACPCPLPPVSISSGTNTAPIYGTYTDTTQIKVEMGLFSGPVEDTEYGQLQAQSITQTNQSLPNV